MERKYYYSINLIRIFVAVILACLYHYIVVFGTSPFRFKDIEIILGEFSYIGVEMFFLISGFVIYGAYAEKISSGYVSFGAYLKGRIRRIYPMMILSVVFMAAAQWINYYLYNSYAIMDYYDGRNTLKAFILSALGLNSGWICDHDRLSINGVTWYISILMICYCIFFGINKITKSNKMLNFIGFSLMIVMGMVLLTHPLGVPLLYTSNARGYFDFFLGCLIALIYKDLLTDKSRPWLLGFALVVILAYIGFYLRNGFNNYACSLLLNTGLFVLMTNIEILERWSDNSFVKYLGKISFPIYLWNLPVFAVIKLFINIRQVQLDYSSIITWLVFAIANIFVAIIVQFLLDKCERIIRG